MSSPADLAIAQASANHYRALAEHYTTMASTMSDALWAVITALRIPPQSDAELAGKRVVFGMYDADMVAERVWKLANIDEPNWLGAIILHAEAVHGCEHTGEARPHAGLPPRRGTSGPEEATTEAG